MSSVESGCEHPITLLMTGVDTRTGEVIERTYKKDCRSRFMDKCAHCAEVFRGDAFRVFRSGLSDALGAEYATTFLTLTAPGADVFGLIHQRTEIEIAKKKTKKKRGRGQGKKKARTKVLPCKCGETHAEDSEILGTPLDPETYRYDLAADFNGKCSRLLAVTMQKLSRILGHPVERIRVAEYQARGLVHFHILVRGIVPEWAFHLAVLGGTNPRTGRRISKSSSGGWSWGPQCDIKHILPGGEVGIGYYLVKLVGYAVKNTDSGASSTADHRRRMQSAALRTCTCKAGPDCQCGSMKIPDAPGNYQCKQSERLCQRHLRAWRGWGYRGNVLAVSRSWGITFTQVRALRSTFAERANSRPSPVQIIGWTVIPRGSPRLAVAA